MQKVLSKFTTLENVTWKTDWWSMFLSKLDQNHAALPKFIAHMTSQCHGRLELTEHGISWKFLRFQWQHKLLMSCQFLLHLAMFGKKICFKLQTKLLHLRIKPRWNPDNCVDSNCWLLIKYNYRLANHKMKRLKNDAWHYKNRILSITSLIFIQRSSSHPTSVTSNCPFLTLSWK